MQATAGESRTKERTRRAILLGSIQVLSANPRASLSDIADHVGVARSTLHRYYADREALTQGISDFVEAEYRAIVARADLEQGLGGEAFLRLAAEFFDALDVLSWWMGALERTDIGDQGTTGLFDESDDDDRAIRTLIERGCADGTIDPLVDVDWVIGSLWSMLYTAWAVSLEGGSRVRAREQCLRVIAKVIAP